MKKFVIAVMTSVIVFLNFGATAMAYPPGGGVGGDGGAVTIPTGGLPATGSSGVSTMAIIAIGLLIVGVSLFVVSQVRRRQTVMA